MIRIATQEQMAFPRLDVFEAGLHTSNWPSIDGLRVRPERPVIGQGDTLRTEISLPVMTIGVDCKVTDFEPGYNVKIEGASKLAKAALHFMLQDENEGTAVHYSLELHLRSMAAKMAAPVVRNYLATAIPAFASAYKQNIEQFLSKQEA